MHACAFDWCLIAQFTNIHLYKICNRTHLSNSVKVKVYTELYRIRNQSQNTLSVFFLYLPLGLLTYSTSLGVYLIFLFLTVSDSLKLLHATYIIGYHCQLLLLLLLRFAIFLVLDLFLLCSFVWFIWFFICIEHRHVCMYVSVEHIVE